MPMVVYTEDEVIEQCNKAEADGAAKTNAALTDAKTIIASMRKLLSDVDVTVSAHGHMDVGTPLHERIQQALEATTD